MDIIVEDTNILIDLFNTGLIRFCQLMDVSFHTTRYVVKEINDPEQHKLLYGLIANGMLIVDSFEGEAFIQLIETTAEYDATTNLTETDCSVMLLAERLGCRLLTADQKLKHYAMERGIQVNGFLWIVDELIVRSIVPPLQMIQYLDIYLKTNSRAPEIEVKRLMEKYERMKNM